MVALLQYVDLHPVLQEVLGVGWGWVRVKSEATRKQGCGDNRVPERMRAALSPRAGGADCAFEGERDGHRDQYLLGEHTPIPESECISLSHGFLRCKKREVDATNLICM